MKEFRGTTVIGLIHKGHAVIAGDGQVTLEDTVVKHTAKKVRKIYKGRVLAGFAGAVADALTLFERMEEKLEEFNGNLPRAVVELARDWRQDRVLRRLEALLIVLDKEHAFLVSGSGEIIEPDDKIIAIGSGAPYAQAVAKALVKHTNLSAREIADEAIRIASEICIYTNSNVTVLEI